MRVGLPLRMQSCKIYICMYSKKCTLFSEMMLSIACCFALYLMSFLQIDVNYQQELIRRQTFSLKLILILWQGLSYITMFFDFVSTTHTFDLRTTDIFKQPFPAIGKSEPKSFNKFSENQKPKDFEQGTEYIFKLLFVGSNHLAAVSERSVQVFSLDKKTQKQENKQKGHQAVGSLQVGKILLETLHTGKCQSQLLESRQDAKEARIISGENTSLFSEVMSSFVVLIATSDPINKLLVLVKIDLQRLQTSHELITLETRKAYDFMLQGSKYSLELNPQVMCMTDSSTVILKRKFYSDTLVVILRSPQEQKLKALIQKTSSHATTCRSIKYWEFYINEECLSLLDSSRLLVNYRQLINKSFADIDVIDIRLKQIRSLRLHEQVEKFQIVCVQKVASNQQNGDVLRLFTTLRGSEVTKIIDYDLHTAVLNCSYTIKQFTFDIVSMTHRADKWFFAFILDKEGNRSARIFTSDHPSAWTNTLSISNSDLMSQIGEQVLEEELWNLESGSVCRYSYNPRSDQLKVLQQKVISKDIMLMHLAYSLKLPKFESMSGQIQEVSFGTESEELRNQIFGLLKSI